MNKSLSYAIIILLLLVFVGYMVFDFAIRTKIDSNTSVASDDTDNPDPWTISRVFDPGKGQLNAVFASGNGNIILGGESFVACYNSSLDLLWSFDADMPVTAVAANKKNVYAAVPGMIVVLSINGEKIEEWGPYEENSMVTSMSANEEYIVFADAANKTIFVLDYEGVVKHIIGKTGDPFIIPSLYFDVAITEDNIIYAANTGNRRIEKRSLDGTLSDYFGKAGTAPDAFCGCCNPSHFAVIPGGFITAEKGINRIKRLDIRGDFVEFISSKNNFLPPLPLDISSTDGKLIYGVNPADSKLYLFARK